MHESVQPHSKPIRNTAFTENIYRKYFRISQFWSSLQSVEQEFQNGGLHTVERDSPSSVFCSMKYQNLKISYKILKKSC